MSFTRLNNLLTAPMKQACIPNGSALRNGYGAGVGFAGQLQQVRHHAPICGPPRFPLSTGQKLLMGVLPILLMMVIPFWAISQMPRWSALHNNLPWGEDEPEEEEEVPKE